MYGTDCAFPTLWLWLLHVALFPRTGSKKKEIKPIYLVPTLFEAMSDQGIPNEIVSVTAGPIDDLRSHSDMVPRKNRWNRSKRPVGSDHSLGFPQKKPTDVLFAHAIQDACLFVNSKEEPSVLSPSREQPKDTSKFPQDPIPKSSPVIQDFDVWQSTNMMKVNPITNKLSVCDLTPANSHVLCIGIP